ncbi:hypothetical protein [Pseudomonas graminis]|uniref:hypothetical protein n=1 Tax=Pseudomonas graminis TaxID=158627 RepID=UPI003C248E64
MANPSITQPANISADVALELGSHQSAQQLRRLQAKLTTTAREIQGLITGGYSLHGRIGVTLSPEQIQLLHDAAKLIESVGINIEHAKEKRQRNEVSAKTRQKDREREAKQLVALTYPLPSATVEQKLEIIRLVLVHSRAGCFQPFYTPVEMSLRLRNYVSAPPRSHVYKGQNNYWENKVEAFGSELREEVELFLATDDGKSVHERFNALQMAVQEARASVLGASYEMETLRLWAAVLSDAQLRRSGK